MNFRYTTKHGIFETDYYFEIPWRKLHSLNDKPAFENSSNGHKRWCFEGKYHRETGPAVIWSNGTYDFWLNENYYNNVNDWLENHPNKEIEFQAMMRLKYT